ncbi:MAG: anaerobic ribonucleoside-triphosphate reductase [Alphaproteobacteria bacterium]|jgi:anaerobic ribonucleoside-triphosphate reductase|nr:anaerobic ribonucleoside-triphosphate reductase [Alphaproteobacteria bacterium]
MDNSKRTKCEVWTKVMGFIRPFNNFNIGKKSEFKERKYFKENACGCSQNLS